MHKSINLRKLEKYTPLASREVAVKNQKRNGKKYSRKDTKKEGKTNISFAAEKKNFILGRGFGLSTSEQIEQLL
jgi:hypothetical protein